MKVLLRANKAGQVIATVVDGNTEYESIFLDEDCGVIHDLEMFSGAIQDLLCTLGVDDVPVEATGCK